MANNLKYQTEYIDKCMDLFRRCAITCSRSEEQKFVALMQIALRVFDLTSEYERERILKCHRKVKMPNGQVFSHREIKYFATGEYIQDGEHSQTRTDSDDSEVNELDAESIIVD